MLTAANGHQFSTMAGNRETSIQNITQSIVTYINKVLDGESVSKLHGPRSRKRSPPRSETARCGWCRSHDHPHPLTCGLR